MLPGSNQNFNPVRQPHIHTRPEAYHTHPLTPHYAVAYRFPAQDAPRHPPGNLLEDHFPVIGGDVKCVLFVFR